MGRVLTGEGFDEDEDKVTEIYWIHFAERKGERDDTY